MKEGWSTREVRHEDYAEIVAHRLCVYVYVAAKALKALDSNPRQAFAKLANMGDEKAISYILSV